MDTERLKIPVWYQEAEHLYPLCKENYVAQPPGAHPERQVGSRSLREQVRGQAREAAAA